MKHERCKTCGEWSWSDRHQCDPAWTAWVPDWGTEPGDHPLVYGIDATSAAEKFGSRVVEEDGEGLGRAMQGLEVHLRRAGTDDVVKVKLTGEWVVDWWGQEVKG